MTSNVTYSTIILTKWAEKQLEKIPKYIYKAFLIWVDDVENNGIYTVRKKPGYHDEPLKGDRKGERSVRLSRSYRIFYKELETSKILLVTGVNKHDY